MVYCNIYDKVHEDKHRLCVITCFKTIFKFNYKPHFKNFNYYMKSYGFLTFFATEFIFTSHEKKTSY